MKYAVKVCFDGKDDWVYVTVDRIPLEDLEMEPLDPPPMIFDDKESAEEIADTFRIDGKEDNVKVVEYEY